MNIIGNFLRTDGCDAYIFSGDDFLPTVGIRECDGWGEVTVSFVISFETLHIVIIAFDIASSLRGFYPAEQEMRCRAELVYAE